MNNDQHPDADETAGINFRHFTEVLGRRWRTILAVAAAVALTVTLAGAVFAVFQPAPRLVSMLEFRPTFAGAMAGEYPNKSPYAVTDITAPPVLDSVYQRNELSRYCDLQTFQTGIAVEQRSTEFVSLEAQYAGLLSEQRMAPVERVRLETEYAAKRRALPLYYRLIYTVPRGCAGMPAETVSKVLHETLEQWAAQSELQRGVLRFQVEMLSPQAFADILERANASLLARATLLRDALTRQIANVESVRALSGAATVRDDHSGLSFLDIGNRLVDLRDAELLPLLTHGGMFGNESADYVAALLSTSTSARRIAEANSQAYLNALREYSGAASADSGGRSSTPATARELDRTGDGQAVTTQIDRTFVDRLLQMSEANVLFRQELTKSLVNSNLELAARQSDVEFHERLMRAIQSAPRSISTTVGAEPIERIARRAKEISTQFSALFDKYSRVSLRTAPALYAVQSPAYSPSRTARPAMSLAQIALVAFVMAGLLMTTYLLIRTPVSTSRDGSAIE
jgi:hypothetical protein